MSALACANGPAGAAEVRNGPLAKSVRHVAPDARFRLLELGGRKVRWALPSGGLPATVTYAFVTRPMQFKGARNCDAMTSPAAALRPSGIEAAAFRAEVEAAFSAWEKAANIVFRETQSVEAAGILIGADAKPRGRAFTNVALREDAGGNQDTAAIGAIRQSLICLNPRRPWKIGFDGNLDVYDIRYTVMHEIGHAIGLDHPGPAGQLMSFRYVETSRGLQPGDTQGAAALYGTPGGKVAPLAPVDGMKQALQRTEPTFGLGEPTAAK